MKLFSCLAIFACLYFASVVSAQQRDYFLPKPSVQKYAVIIGGAAVEKRYVDQIKQWGLHLHEILTRDYGYSPEQIVLLMDQANPDNARISGSSRGEIIKASFDGLKAVLSPGDQVFIFLLGHGTSNEEAAKFVIAGPDITAEDLAAILESFSQQDIVLVNAASSSYPFCAFLAGPGRVIVSATRSGAEKYNTVFAEYFIAALEGHAGDRDKNRRVSILEAFQFATVNVEKWYTEQSRVPTEHAVLDDNGDGVFSDAPDPLEGEGRLAQIAYLDLIAAKRPVDGEAAAAETAAIRDLTAKMRELERAVFLWRNRKAELPQELYQQEMEGLLIELARVSKNLRNMTTAPGD